MEFSEVLHGRRSIRDFTEKEIGDETLRDIVSDARQAPSWENCQPWRVYIATGTTLQKIRDEHAARSDRGDKGKADIPTMHRVDWEQWPVDNMKKLNQHFFKFMGDDIGDFKASQRNLFNAPALVYLTIPKKTPQWEIFDLGGFEQTLMFAATSRGVDSVPAYEIVKYPDIIRRNMEIPDEEIIAAGIALGYASNAKINGIIAEREPLEKILTIKN